MYQGVAYASPKIDITDQIIKALGKQHLNEMDSFSINEIGKFLDCEISGDVNIKVNKISSLGNDKMHTFKYDP